ncbi:MAG TPA: radical SAM protein [Gemmataceae bacterium]|jgi:DNA repair photolyase|nr:radical SAM protein [Gemmataceae bacterium]
MIATSLALAPSSRGLLDGRDGDVSVLPRVYFASRETAGLHPSPFADQADVLSLNLTRGCVHRCPFCSVRAHGSYAGDTAICLFKDTARHLDKDLSTRRKRPRAVFISPSTDPFPPISEIQAETARVVSVLAKHEIEAWLMTRGFIRPSAMRALEEQRKWVKVTVGMTTLDRALQRRLEPLCASPCLRLRQIAALRASGIAVQVALEPLIPGLTDTRECLVPVLEALAQLGVRHVRTSYLYLRTGIEENLVGALEPAGLAPAVLEAFAGGPILSSGTIAPARYLPKARRQRGYAALMALAAGFGITVSVCGTTNPDFCAPRSRAAEKPRRPLLTCLN